MRNAFIKQLMTVARNDDRVVLLVGDLGFGVVEEFAKEFPDRFYNCGVAEQSMLGLAAGLAKCGFRVFVYSIANFPTFRCAEQIRNDVDYHNLDVCIVSVGGGVAYGNLGYSHHAIQDYGLIRLFPHFEIISPADPIETRLAVDHIVKTSGPKYLRLGKAGEPVLFKEDTKIGSGELNYLIRGSREKLILTTGTTAELALELQKREENLRDFSVATLPIWGLGLAKKIKTLIEGHREIITIENHLLVSGFGSWLLEIANDHDLVVKIKRFGFDERVHGLVGSQSYIHDKSGLQFSEIAGKFS